MKIITKVIFLKITHKTNEKISYINTFMTQVSRKIVNIRLLIFK